MVNSLWRRQIEEYFCEHICPGREIIKTRRVDARDVCREGTKSFITQEHDLGASAKSLFIEMVVMIMVLPVNNVGKREIVVGLFVSP